MLQQILALIIIAIFLARLIWQKQKQQIGANEFIFWLCFWMLAAASIIFLKWIDKLVASIGFTGSGIDVLIYLGVAILFYLIFRLRLKMEKINKELTKIVREIAIINNLKEKNNK